ncbi:MAG TPA: glycerol-3-phosphate 1-O-acyltransferase PlsY [Verrucomicrobiae bacterium]|nr:glycerol-3-phosphate 1-O-acyltransferase PlsY [Verrucomicrobiae bacterium]
MLKLAFIAVASYLLGSIPFGYILVRLIYGEDVRRTGSGNIGATNVSRKSPALGIVTLLLDALKGSAAVALASLLCQSVGASTAYRNMSLAALFAVAGHIFPVWLKFRGGKGVATGLGSFAILAPKAVLIAAALFAAVVAASRFVSLGSIIAVLTFPILAWLMHEYGNSVTALMSMSLASLLIVAKHHANIRRLLSGTESRFGARRTSTTEPGTAKTK